MAPKRWGGGRPAPSGRSRELRVPYASGEVTSKAGTHQHEREEPHERDRHCRHASALIHFAAGHIGNAARASARAPSRAFYIVATTSLTRAVMSSNARDERECSGSMARSAVGRRGPSGGSALGEALRRLAKSRVTDGYVTCSTSLQTKRNARPHERNGGIEHMYMHRLTDPQCESSVEDTQSTLT